MHQDSFTEDPEPRLIAGKSKSSGNYTFPPYLADPVCFQDDIEHVNLPRNGILHSFTIVRRSLPDFPVPFGLGLIDFPEQEIRVMAQVEADDQQVNLTRFSLFFPEKRLFFQERASIFDFRTGGRDNLFYIFKIIAIQKIWKSSTITIRLVYLFTSS